MGWMNLNKSDWRYVINAFDEDTLNSAYNFMEHLSPKKFRAVSSKMAQQHPQEACFVADLKNVPSHVPVYVIAHGAKGKDYIADQTRKLKMGPEDLAKKLTELPKGHKVIKLFICELGLDLIEHNGAKDGFAYKFWAAMHGDGYDKLWVVCYLGVTADPGYVALKDHKAVAGDLTEDKWWERASKYRAFIDPDGNIHDRNPPPLL